MHLTLFRVCRNFNFVEFKTRLSPRCIWVDAKLEIYTCKKSKIETFMMKAAVKTKPSDKTQNGNFVMASLNKALTAESEWEDKDEFLDVIYWMRQILGLILGIIWGLLPLKGILGLIIFFAVNVGIVYFYYNSFQKIDDEEYGGPSEILKEGLMTSFSTFLVAWILLYSSLHTDL